MREDLDKLLRISFPENRNDRNTEKAKQEHIILLIHGIRTHAPWFEKVRIVFNRESNVSCRNAGYGYFDTFRFLIPFFRRKPVRRVISQIEAIRKDNPDARLSIIAHSFGTYIFSEILKYSQFRFYRVVLCGSIVKINFAWEKYGDRITSSNNDLKILNECGTRDIWPLLAGFVTYGYGASGTVGTRNTYVRDRFHELGHSGYFEEDFIMQHWIPFLLRGEYQSSQIDLDRSSPPLWQSIITITSLWHIVLFSSFICLLAIILF